MIDFTLQGVISKFREQTTHFYPQFYTCSRYLSIGMIVCTTMKSPNEKAFSNLDHDKRSKAIRIDGRNQDHVKKKYRVTPSWKEKKEVRNPVMNTGDCEDLTGNHFAPNMNLSTNQRN